MDELSLEEDANLTLNPLWSDAFLAFMELSHLPPEHLLVFGQALLHAYPPAPDTPGPRYPLTIDALGRWLKKMYENPEFVAYRAECIESLDDPDALSCCLATAPIELWDDQQPKLLGTLIIAFERRSRLLIHHLVRREPTAMDVLFLAEKLAQKAIQRLGKESFSESWRNLVLPWHANKREWSRDLYWLFEKNLPIAMRAPAKDVSNRHPRNLEDSKPDLEQKLLQCNVQGRPFKTRYDLWSPMYHGVSHPFPTIYCSEQDGVNQVHDLFAEAAVLTRIAFRKLAPTLAEGAPLPTWEVQSRARRKAAE